MPINKVRSMIRGWLFMNPDEPAAHSSVPLKMHGIHVGALQKRAIEHVLRRSGMSKKQALRVLAMILEILKNENS
ncbi:hypothetical protein [Azonexus sp.]|uniref:hypothetical protein n=1 Tax=Azonexus sp. TaxID=1872668 RepID=UPI0035AFE778